MFLCAVLALSFPTFRYTSPVRACFECGNLCHTAYEALPEDVRAAYPIAPYAPDRYVHVQHINTPPRYQVAIGRGGVETIVGQYADIRTAAVVGQYAEITGRSFEEIWCDLGLE